MNAKTLRNRIFTLHRYVGSVVGLIAVIVGLTGSLLVFHAEIIHFEQQHRTTLRWSRTSRGDCLESQTKATSFSCQWRED